MKTTTKLKLLSIMLVGLSLNAEAKTHYPRDLACNVNGGQTKITLRSNNGLWSNFANDKRTVELVIEKDGQTTVAHYVGGNNASTFTRGNDQPNRKYIFATDAGEEFFVDLQFRAPHGMPEGIDRFNVLSRTLNFEHKQFFIKKGICDIIYFEAIEL